MNTTRTGTTRKRVHAATALYDQHEAMQQVAHDLFNLTITLFDTDNDFDGDKNASINNMISSVQDNTGAACSTRLDNSREMESGDTKMDGADNDEDDDSDEDGPVIVEMQDVQASYERIAALSRSTLTLHNDSDHDHDSDRRHRVQYPFLFAAISNDEDIVMACARILDEQRDVTLVREAAAYLEDVEAKM
jgi:A1 cistron-splicing factor AAR2